MDMERGLGYRKIIKLRSQPGSDGANLRSVAACSCRGERKLKFMTKSEWKLSSREVHQSSAATIPHRPRLRLLLKFQQGKSSLRKCLRIPETRHRHSCALGPMTKPLPLGSATNDLDSGNIKQTPRLEYRQLLSQRRWPDTLRCVTRT
jgi:hypothetical protein